MNDPAYPLSVVLPVYNSESYLEESVRSVLRQTFTDFEFIIINDGSTDKSSSIIHPYTIDPRVKLIEYPENKGNYPRRNEGCRLAKGKYICVMDADDVAMPERFEQQFKLMEQNPDIQACGTSFLFSNGNPYPRPLAYELIKVMLLNNNMFLHPSLMIRKDALEEVNYYDEAYCYSSDYDLMCRLCLKGKVINLPDILMTYRLHPDQISKTLHKEQQMYADRIRINYFKRCGFSFTPDEYNIINQIMNRIPDPAIPERGLSIIEKMKEQVSKIRYFSYPVFCKVMDMIYNKYRTLSESQI